MQQITETIDSRGVPKPLAQDRFLTFKMSALGAPGRIVALPVHGRAASEVAKKVLNDAIAATAKFDSQVEEFSLRVKGGHTDATTARTWQTNERIARQMDLRKALEVVQANQAKTAEARNKILTVPPIPANDLTTAISDNEVRQAMRTMTADQTTKIYAEIGNGQHAHVLRALARDPVPNSSLGTGARAMYGAQMKQLHNDELHALDQQDESHGAIIASLQELQKLVAS